jgi:hypothetical protein
LRRGKGEEKEKGEKLVGEMREEEREKEKKRNRWM